MMYSEFVAGTGCKDTANNYKVFERLEVMYTNTDMTKEEIYEYGKKLVDNSKTPEELAFEARIKERIENLKDTIATTMQSAKMYEEFAENECDPSWKKNWKSDAKRCREWAKQDRAEIRRLKAMIA